MNIFARGLKRSKDTWFGQVTRLFDRENIDESVWDELEELLVAADVGMATTEKLLERIKSRIATEKISDGAAVKVLLKEEMVRLLTLPEAALKTPAAKPHVTLVVGVNGSGKTTSIAKIARQHLADGEKVLLAAADTFRAAAIDQLKELGNRIDADVISHQPGGDPGAVAFDALAAAQSRGVDTLIIDTAGRLHTKFNLMEELKKIHRVIVKQDASAPHEVMLVLDATTGQNGLLQAHHFAEAVGVTDIFLTKLDTTAKGGIVLAISDQLGIPIRYIGVGDELDAVAPFDAVAFIDELTSE
jgi:fused signal recognition particle receptor